MLNTLVYYVQHLFFFFIVEKVTEEKSNAFLAAYGKGGKKNLSIFALLISRKHTDNTVISTVHTF